MKKSSVIHMVTVPKSLELMRGQLKYLESEGFDVGVISSPGKELEKLEVEQKIPVKMEREINPKRDIISLYHLTKLLQQKKPFILNTGTPKAGLLAILAAYLTGVPHRIYTLRGLKLETSSGFKRKILWITEKITCLLATKVICISPSLRDEAILLGLVKKEKTMLLGKGSSNGINLRNYPEPNCILSKVKETRQQLNLEDSDFIIGFVGRIVRDKGVNELIKAFKMLNSELENVKLLLLGSFESGDPISDEAHQEIKHNPKIIHLGHIEQPAIYYYLMDVFVFPTYREGFGNVSIQAQAAQVPVITTNATGARDTIVNGETGLLIEKQNVKQIIESILYLYENKEIRLEMGENGRARVVENFDSNLIWEEMAELYNQFKEN